MQKIVVKPFVPPVNIRQIIVLKTIFYLDVDRELAAVLCSIETDSTKPNFGVHLQDKAVLKLVHWFFRILLEILISLLTSKATALILPPWTHCSIPDSIL